ncbi:MAG TPA: glycosyltransferase family 9 protein [Flavobacterium sp.]
MRNILFLHDTGLSLLRGAELTIKQLMGLGEKRGFRVTADLLKDFESTKKHVLAADLVVLNSTSRCTYELHLLMFLIESKVEYIKVEYDYNFCVRRNILCTVDRNIRLCCNTDKFHLYRRIFAKSRLNVFQSPKHYQSHETFYGEAVKHHLIMPPTVEVDLLQPSPVRSENTIPLFGELNYLKGGDAYLEFAEAHPEKIFEVYGINKLRRAIPSNVIFKETVSNDKVLEILGRTKYFFCKPVWPEPSGRLAAEAFLSGCEIISNDRVGTFSFDFYPNNPEQAKAEIAAAPGIFWDLAEKIVHKSSRDQKQPKLGKVLVYKSYGGLGDIFFCVPSLYVLKEVSEEVTFAVKSRLVEFFKKHLPGMMVVDEDVVREDETAYDKVIELGNYPAFRGYDLPHALKYPTHKRVKQHAIGHYIDAVAKFHIGADTRKKPYPYFKRKTNFETPYYTMHPGAGFLLKIWPTKNYADLIQAIHLIYPTLRCKIILGPEDPDPIQYFDSTPEYVEYVTGGMEDVGKAMAGAVFHIGNDAGITHVAGAFNVPTVGIYGPTGPGSWGCFSEHSEIIWGKSGNCDLRCNYDVIINCGNRVCLSSITPTKVMAALFKLLQKAYPELEHTEVINPVVNVDLTDSDCLLTINGNEFVVNFTDVDTYLNVSNILSGKFGYATNNDLQQFVAFLHQQDIAFSIPTFGSPKLEVSV